MFRQCRLPIVNVFFTSMLIIVLVSGCSVMAPQSDEGASLRINALQTERAVLQTQLVNLDPTPTSIPTSTLRPTSTPPPESTLPVETEQVKLLPKPLYFLKPDTRGNDQVYRLAEDGVTQTQVTFETQGILDFDVSPRGDLAFILHQPEDSYRLFLLKSGTSGQAMLVEERDGEQELLRNVRWHPNGDQLIYHRTVEILPEEEVETAGQAAPDPTSEPALRAAELVLYNILTDRMEVLLRKTEGSEIDGNITLSTNETLEYEAANDWQVVFNVTAITPNGLFILLNDTGGPAWMLHDLRSGSTDRVQIIANSGDLSPDGKTLCLASEMDKSGFTPPQALLCGDMDSGAVTIHLNNPPWNPFAVNLWPEENALVFLQLDQTADTGTSLKMYGLNLSSQEPLLLRSELLQLEGSEPRPIEALYAPAENQESGLIVIAGWSQEMESPGLLIMPIDPDKSTSYLPGPGSVTNLRWGP